MSTNLFVRLVLTAVACACLSAVCVGMVLAEAAGRVTFTDLLMMAAAAPWLGLATAAMFVLTAPDDRDAPDDQDGGA